MILHVHCSLGLYVNQIGFSFSVYFGPEITIFFFKDRNSRGKDFDFSSLILFWRNLGRLLLVVVVLIDFLFNASYFILRKY